MSVLLQILGRGDGEPTPFSGQYLVSYDPDIEPLNGLIVTSLDKAKAHRFADVDAAAECWRRVSGTMPKRLTDGKPNRPLTAYTVTFEVMS